MHASLRRALAAACLALGLAWLAPAAQASVVIAGTRVVYRASEAEETIRLSNEGAAPALVQAWVDAGDATAAPSAIEVPFTITPPIARIDPKKSQTLRLVYTGEPLPQDRESVFWLNMLEVPPKPGAELAGANTLQLAFRTRIKIFFRPTGLPGSAGEAPARIVWRLMRSGDQLAVEAHNPTPYHVSFTRVAVHSGNEMATFDDGGMVEPGASKVFPLKGGIGAPAGVQVRYRALNDFGGPIEGEAPLTQGANEAGQ